MQLGRVTKSDCVNVSPPPDPRCADEAFALANPDVCPTAPFLLIKPSTALTCPLGSVQFRAFYVQNDIELDVTNKSLFGSSDPNVAVVGSISGNATGLAQGVATISASYQGKTAYASLDVIGSGTTGNCCDNEPVAMMLMVDTSRSMSLAFSGSYSTRLAFAKFAATRFINEVNQTKDFVGLMRFNALDDIVVAPLTGDKASVVAQVPGITQTQQSTSFYDALSTAIDALNGSPAVLKVIVLVSDGEDETSSYLNNNNPIALLADFKSQGGIVICLGCRASGRGFALLSDLATGGFLINAYPGTEQASLDYFSGLKGYICAGNCTPAGDTIVATGQLNYTGFKNWNVVGGTVDLQGNGFLDFLPGNGLYVDLAGTTPPAKGKLVLKTPFTLISGDAYRLTADLSGNQRVNATPESARLQVYFYPGNDQTQPPVYLIDQKVTVNDYTQPFQTYSFTFTAPAAVQAYISIQQEDEPVGGDPRIGLMLNRVTFTDTTSLKTLLDDNFDTENLTYIPPRCGVGTTYALGFGPIIVHGSVQTPGNLVATFTTNAPHNLSSGMKGLITGANEPFFNGMVTITVTGPSTFTYPVEANPGAIDLNVTGTFSGVGYGYAYGYNCYGTGCLTSPPVAQVPDPNPLSDIEAGYTPPKQYSSTQTACATCPAGTVNLNAGNLIPAMTSNTAPSGVASASSIANSDTDAWKAFDHITDFTGAVLTQRWACATGQFPAWLRYQFPTAQIVTSYSVTAWKDTYSGPKDFQFQASNDGLVWTTLDTRTGITWFSGETKTFQFANTTAYLYYRLYITATAPFGSNPNITAVVELQMFSDANGQACATASATSTISQADADRQAYAAALAAAQAQLNCQTVYTSTQQYTARCPAGSFGQPVTKSATATSLVSQAEADAAALAAAQAAAQAALDCTLSNNTQRIVINDATNAGVAPATPYPSVQYVSGLTGNITQITLTLLGISHTHPDDIHVMLRSPNGTCVSVFRNAGNGFTISNLNLVFKSGGPYGTLPDEGQIVAGTYDCSNYDVDVIYPAPAPAGPYGTNMNNFIGQSPNGSWSLWVLDDTSLDVGSIANGFTVSFLTA